MSDKQMIRFYKQKLYNNRSILARSFDFAALRLAFFGVMVLLLRPRLNSILAAAFVALVAVAMLSVALHVLSSVRLEKFIKEYKGILRRQYIKERLSLLNSSFFMNLCKTVLIEKGCRIIFIRNKRGIAVKNKKLVYIEMLQNHCSEPLSAQELLDFYHRAKEKHTPQAMIFFCTSLSSEAKEFLEKITDLEIECVAEESLVQSAKKIGLSPSPEDIVQMIIKETESRRKAKASFRSIIFMPQKTKRYALSGVLLYIMSFFTGYNLYFRIIAIVLFALSALSLFYATSKTKMGFGK
ncbi:MAG: hypothetical protein ACYCX2_07700 [Christensenellales bacterium]